MTLELFDQVYDRFATRRFPDVSDEQVAALEEQLGVRLPEDYRQFLLAYNGGYFDDPAIMCEDERFRGDGLNLLYGINAGEDDLSDPNSLDLFEGNDPLMLLPIGYTLMGALLILGIDEEIRGEIYYKVAFGDVYWLADGIEELFGMLREDDDE